MLSRLCSVRLALALAAATPASAQPAPRTSTRPIVLDLTCAPAFERFCPALAGTHQLRNQVICLKPYRMSLSLPCRRAVTAASR